MLDFKLLEEQTIQRIKDVEIKWDKLKKGESSNLLIEKLESMNSQFIYNIFYPTLKPLNSLENIEENYQVLINALYDDSELYINKIIDYNEKNIVDKLNLTLIKLGKPIKEYEPKEIINNEEGGIYCNQDTILSFIDRYEKIEIVKLNRISDFALKNDRDLSDFISDNSKILVESFSKENILLLNQHISDFLQIEINDFELERF